jgi:two-component system nitrate/nitrite response regulator NarL
LEILQLIWAGLKSQQIASRANISIKTVEAHRTIMMKKLNVSNTAQLLQAALRNGMIRVQ